MLGFSDGLFLLIEIGALINRALIGFVGFLVVYKLLLPLLFRFRKVDPVFVMGILYLLLQISLKAGGPSTGW